MRRIITITIITYTFFPLTVLHANNISEFISPTPLKVIKDSVYSISISPDGRYLASGSNDRILRLWEVSTGELFKALKDQKGYVRSVTFSPDGSLLAAGMWHETIIIWNVEAGNKINTLKGHLGEVLSVSFSPDGRYLASGSSDRTARLWYVSTGEVFKTLKGHKGYVRSVSFSPDGRYLASGSNDRTVKVWEVSTGELLQTIKGHKGSVRSISFSPDGKYLVSGGDDRRIALWGAEDESLVFNKSLKPLYAPVSSPSVEMPSEVPWVSSFKTAPELTYSVSVYDSNSNKIFEGGEEVGLRVKVKNVGKGIAEEVWVKLNGAEDLLRFLGSRMDIGDIAPDEEKEVIFTAFLPTEIDAKTEILRIEVKESRGYSPTEVHNLTIGLKPPEIRERTKIISKLIDVDVIPQKVKYVKQPNRYALVIGISKYREDLIPQVKYAKKDAEVVAKYFNSIVGIPRRNIKTILDENVTKSDMVASIKEWLYRRVDKDSTVFVYYAGHGSPDVEREEAYIVPYEGHPDFPSKLYSLKEMYKALNELPAKEVIVMLDSCFSGGGPRSVAKALTLGRPIGISIENPMLASGKIIVLAAATGSQVSSDYNEVKHGLFTYYLLKGMRGDADDNRDNIVGLGELYHYIRENVSEKASLELNRDQTPMILPGIEQLGEKTKIPISKEK